LISNKSITMTNIINNIIKTIVNEINMLRGFFNFTELTPSSSTTPCFCVYLNRKCPSFSHFQHSFPFSFFLFSLFFLSKFIFIELPLFPYKITFEISIAIFHFLIRVSIKIVIISVFSSAFYINVPFSLLKATFLPLI